MKIVFVHGWGGDALYWRSLAAHFQSDECAFIELGFTGREQKISAPFDQALYITHSLGTMWALENHAAHMMGLVAINGFACFSAFTEEKTLEAMRKGLKRNAKAQMKSFYRAACMPPASALDEERLAQGLDWLSQGDARTALQSIGAPAIALSAEDDKIVPLEATKSQFAQVEVAKQGGHNLTQNKTPWCARAIKKFMESL